MNESQLPPNAEPLTAAMDNVLASRLADIACVAGSPDLKGVGDSIDRGLIFLRLMQEWGFLVVYTKGRDLCMTKRVRGRLYTNLKRGTR